MNTKKRMICLMACLAMTLVGCSSGGSGGSDSSGVDKDADVTTMNLEDQVICIGGVTYGMFDPVSKLLDNGWTLSSRLAQEKTILPSIATETMSFVHEDGSDINVKLNNFTEEKVDYTKGVITYIQAGIERSNQEIVLPKGIVVGKSTTKDLQDAYGGPAVYKDWGYRYNATKDNKPSYYGFSITDNDIISSCSVAVGDKQKAKTKDISFDTTKLLGTDAYIIPLGATFEHIDEIRATSTINVAGVNVKKVKSMKQLVDSGVKLEWKETGHAANATKGNNHFVINFECKDDSKNVDDIVAQVKASGKPSDDLTIFSISMDQAALSSSGDDLFVLPFGITKKSTAQEAFDAYGANYAIVEYEKATLLVSSKFAVQLNYDNNTTLTRCTITPLK